MKKLLIIDSNSILNRAYYGVRYLSASDGTPTNAVYGFFNILWKLIGEEKPDYICAAFDLKAPTFRHKMYDGYKAQRKPMPDELRVQMPIAKEILAAMDIPILQIEGYEADDIIGTVSAKCEADGVKCLIATGDKDDLQLASELTNIILTVTRQGMNETVTYDRTVFTEKYGVQPEEFIDVKALMGDTSDNIPGVAGIGEKTALKLIAQYHSVENLYEQLNPDDFAKGVYQKLSQGKEQAALSKKLAAIRRDVPIDFDREACVFRAEFSENQKLFEILSRLELRSLIKKIGVSGGQAERKKNTAFFDKMEIVHPEEMSDTEQMYAALRQSGTVSVICKTEGKKILSAAIAWGNRAAVWRSGSGFTEEDIRRLICRLFSDETVEKLVFGVKDTLAALAGSCEMKNLKADAAIGAYLINPAKSEYTVEGLAAELLGVEIEAEKINEQLSLLDEDTAENTSEEKRVYVLGALWEEISRRIEENGQHTLYYEVELPLAEVLAKMQYRGFKIEKQELKRFGDTLNLRIEELTDQIYRLAGEEFNINSPKQLGVVLFERLGLPVVKKIRSGYSTNADVLEKLMDKHEIIPLIMEYRTVTKLKSTYCDGLAAVIDPADQKIHSVFTQTVTVTGRISSTEPNMQNIPTRTELGRELRKMFVASDSEHVLVDADYSQIELRVLAHIAGDQRMIEAFRSGEDIHAVTASQVFGVPLESVTREQRSHAKAVNFGIVYGIGEFSLSQDIKVSIREAKRYIESYLDKYHGVREYMERIKAQAKQDGYVKTMMNRIRYIPELKSTNFAQRAFGERVALNTPIQGTAADIIKLAMVRVERRMRQEGLRSVLVLQVHDELIIDAVKEEEAQVKQILREEMENAMELKVPLKVDMESGNSWYDTK